MNDKRDAYQAYLLRLWRVRYQGKWQWRASLQSPHTEERQLFADLDGLCTYLKASFPECQSDIDLKRASPAEESEGADSEDEPPTGQVPDRPARSVFAIGRENAL